MTGKEAENILDEVGITVNKNTIPFDPESPFVTSGIRVGLPAITSRNMGVEQISVIGNLMADVLQDPTNESVKARVSAQVLDITSQFPLYPELG